MAEKLVLLTAYFFLLTGLGIVIMSSMGYSLLNSELTQSEVFINNWPWYLLGIILMVGGIKLFPIENKSNG